MIEVRNVHFAYNGAPVLRDLSTSFRSGRVTALLGPNGAGKSTLLRLVSGEFPPKAGEIEFAGRALRLWKPRELARKRALLTQRPRLNFPFTVEEVVLLGRAPHLSGGEQEEDLDICQKALELTGMAELSRRDYTTLSGGERQRVQVARALAQAWSRHDQALLLDEPVAGLDLAHQHETLRLARLWAADGACVVTVLHDINLALYYADDAVLVDEHHVVAQGPAAEVLQPELIARVFKVSARRIDPGNGEKPFILTR